MQKSKIASLSKLGASLGAAAVFALVTFSSRSASAQNQLSFDLGAAFPSNDGVGDGWGTGFRFGHQYKLLIVTLTPEIAFSYHHFSGPDDATTVAGLGGGRVGIDFVLKPSVFAHAGVGHLAATGVSHTSLAYDVGAALDLTVLPIIDFGPHIMLSGIAGDNGADAFSWLEVGGHVTFNF